jgi:hypothetical protein
MDEKEVKKMITILNRENKKNIAFRDFLDLNERDEILKRYFARMKNSYLDQNSIENYLNQLKKEYNVRVYTPYKYFEGLQTFEQVKSRFFDIVRGKSSDASDPKSYKSFATDEKKSNTKSSYTLAFEKKYGSDTKSLENKSKATGIPLSILEEVFRKGKAAWRTGHRVGANQEQWGYARVHSFIMLGCAAMGADFYLVKRAIQEMKPNDIKNWFSLPIICPENKLKKKYYEKFNAPAFIKNFKIP